MSAAVVQSFQTMSSFTTALLFYRLYDEKLNLQHILGMLMIVASVAIVAVCKSLRQMAEVDQNDIYLTAMDMDDPTKQKEIVKEEHSPFYIILPFLVTFINVGWLTIGSYTARAARAAKYPPTQFSVDFIFTAGVVYFLAFLSIQFFSSDPLGWDLIGFSSFTGLFPACGFLCLNAGMLSGKGALVMAITQT